MIFYFFHQMCVHPGLRSYISECVGSIRPVLEKGEVEKVVVAVLSTEGVPVEKFVFEIMQQPKKPQDIKYVLIVFYLSLVHMPFPAFFYCLYHDAITLLIQLFESNR